MIIRPRSTKVEDWEWIYVEYLYHYGSIWKHIEFVFNGKNHNIGVVNEHEMEETKLNTFSGYNWLKSIVEQPLHYKDITIRQSSEQEYIQLCNKSW